jgi:hypothetical protein
VQFPVWHPTIISANVRDGLLMIASMLFELGKTVMRVGFLELGSTTGSDELPSGSAVIFACS